LIRDCSFHNKYNFERQGSDKIKGGDKGGNNTKGAKTLNHQSIVELTSIAYCYEMLVSCKFSFIMIFVGACW